MEKSGDIRYVMASVLLGFPFFPFLSRYRFLRRWRRLLLLPRVNSWISSGWLSVEAVVDPRLLMVDWTGAWFCFAAERDNESQEEGAHSSKATNRTSKNLQNRQRCWQRRENSRWYSRWFSRWLGLLSNPRRVPSFIKKTKMRRWLIDDSLNN